VHAAHDDDTAGFRVDDEGRLLRDNVYGPIEEDAWRRDFTINALYYDIADFSVRDYADGLTDLRTGVIRLIGEPEQRYREDPVRMLRAVRFAAKLGFRVHPDTEAPLFHLGHLLESIPPARMFEEILKLLLGGCAVQTFELLRHYRLFGHLFPLTERCLAHQQQHFPKTVLMRALENTDARLAENKTVTPAFLFAALLWEPLRELGRRLLDDGLEEFEAWQEAAEDVVRTQLKHTALPRRFSIPMREIWDLQPRLAALAGKQPVRTLAHPRFRAAYDFLLLRAETDAEASALATWWTAFLGMDDAARAEVLAESAKPKRRPRRRKKTPSTETAA
jgi:poly(A) polymerase